MVGDLLKSQKNATMKKIIIFLFVFGFSAVSFGQSAKTTVEQYCQVIATPKLFSNKVTIEVDFGEERSVWKDNRLRTYNGRLKKFDTIIDALNFMGREGWSFVNAYPVTTGTGVIYHFAFKKEVPVDELPGTAF
jgi:hypothetical protein